MVLQKDDKTTETFSRFGSVIVWRVINISLFRNIGGREESMSRDTGRQGTSVTLDSYSYLRSIEDIISFPR